MKRYLRKLVVAVAAVAVTVTVGALAIRPASAQEVDHSIVFNKHSGLCATAFETFVFQFGCDLQFPWEFLNQGSGQFALIDINTERCLTVAGASKNVNAKLVMGACTSSSATRWTVTDTGANDNHIKNVNSGLCMAVENASREEDAELIQVPCNTTAPHNEVWGRFPILVD